jgi:Bacterial SH3 domain
MARNKNMRKIVRLCLGLGIAVALVSPAMAELATIGAPVAMRAAPTDKAGIVQHIPQSAEINLEKCVRDWCRASWRGRSGYIPEEAAVLRPSLATLPGDKMPPPVSASPNSVAPPAFRWTGAYVGVNGGVGSSSWQR